MSTYCGVKALIGAFSVIVKSLCHLLEGSFAALQPTVSLALSSTSLLARLLVSSSWLYSAHSACSRPRASSVTQARYLRSSASSHAHSSLLKYPTL